MLELLEKAFGSLEGLTPEEKVEEYERRYRKLYDILDEAETKEFISDFDVPFSDQGFENDIRDFIAKNIANVSDDTYMAWFDDEVDYCDGCGRRCSYGGYALPEIWRSAGRILCEDCAKAERSD